MFVPRCCFAVVRTERETYKTTKRHKQNSNKNETKISTNILIYMYIYIYLSIFIYIYTYIYRLIYLSFLVGWVVGWWVGWLAGWWLVGGSVERPTPTRPAICKDARRGVEHAKANKTEKKMQCTAKTCFWRQKWGETGQGSAPRRETRPLRRYAPFAHRIQSGVELRSWESVRRQVFWSKTVEKTRLW